MAVRIGASRWSDRHGLCPITVSADTAETGYVNVTSLFRIGQVSQGIQIQAHGSGVIPSFTMAGAETAAIAANDTRVPWKVFASIASGDIVSFPFGATVVRLQFAGPGVAYIGVL